MNEKYKYLGKNTLLFTISSFGTKILSFLLVPLYTSVLSTSEYGTADLITTTATLLVYVLTINIADAVLRFVLDIYNSSTGVSADDKAQNLEAVLSYGNRIVLIGLLLCIFGLGLVYSSGLLDWPSYYYVFTALYFFGTAFYQLVSNYLRGIDKISAVAIVGVISSLVTIVCNIVFLVVVKLGVFGYLLSLVLGPVIAACYGMVVAGAPIRAYLFNSCPKSLKQEMRTYSIPLIFNNVALWVNAFLDRYFVTAMIGVDANGIYSVANKIPLILATCYTVFGQAWNLSAIKEFDPEDKDGFFSKTYDIFNALMCITCSVLIILNIPLASFLYAKDFFEAWQYSSVLLIYVVFNALTMILGSIFSAVKETKVIATTTVVSATANIVFNLLLIPICGPLGSAIATVIAYVVMWVSRLVLAKRYIKLHLHISRDVLVYGLLILQVVFEHMEGHIYLGQAVCLLFIACIYRKQLFTFLKPMKSLLLSAFRK